MLETRKIGKKKVTENRPFALGGGSPREVEIIKGPKAKKDNIITKTMILLINYCYLWSFLSAMVYQKDTTCLQLL